LQRRLQTSKRVLAGRVCSANLKLQKHKNAAKHVDANASALAFAFAFAFASTFRLELHALADEEILVNAVTAKIGQVTSWASNDLGTAEVAAPWAETEYWTPRDERGGDGWALRAAQWDAGIIRGPSRLERTRATHALSMPLSTFVTGVLAIACLFIGSVCLMLRVFA
jgi:hypothetical protein